MIYLWNPSTDSPLRPHSEFGNQGKSKLVAIYRENGERLTAYGYNLGEPTMAGSGVTGDFVYFTL